MSELVADCPRCGASRITFDLVSQTHVSTRYDWQRWYEAFCICRHSGRSTVFVLAEEGIDEGKLIRKSSLAQINGAVNGLGVTLVCQMEGMVVPLKEWSLELGEIVYSLRSALDNLIYVCAQIRADPPPRPRDLQFPIIQDSLQYNTAVRNIASQLPEDIADLLERVQPYQRGKPDVEGSPEHDPLVLLNWISNHDKHRMPVPFLVPPSQIEFAQTCEFASEADAAANVPPDVVIHAGPLSHGTTLLEHRTKHPVTKVSGQFKITAHVAFETHAGTREVSEAIGQLAWYTRLVVDEFSKKIG